MRPGRSTGTSSTGMTWRLVGVRMRSTSWIRPGSPRRHLGICLLGVVFLVVFVKYLFLSDLSCYFFFLLIVCVVFGFGFSCVGSSFFFCCYICYVITMVFGSWVLVVLWLFLLVFLLLGKARFSCFVLIFGFKYTELLPGWLTSEAFADQMLR